VHVSRPLCGGVLEDTPQPGPHSTLTLMVQGKDVVSVDDLTVGRGRAIPGGER